MRTFRIVLISAASIAVAAAVAVGFRAGARSDPEPATTSGVPRTAAKLEQTESAGVAPAALQSRGAPGGRATEIVAAIERALVARDRNQRDTAFAFLLPELIDLDSLRAAALVSRQEPGEVREALRDEVVRLWIVRDRDAAGAWIGSLENQAELEASAAIAMRTLAASSPAHAIEVADQFGIGRNDGSLEHIVQIWAAEKPDEARRWLAQQPRDDPRTVQLQARMDAR